MSETVKIVLMVLLALGALIISRWINGWQMKRAGASIIQDLEKKRAFDPESAVELPYCRDRVFRLGLKDYRPRMVKQLIAYDVVRMHAGEKYYLREGRKAGDCGRN